MSETVYMAEKHPNDYPFTHSSCGGLVSSFAARS
jgi:hypothetical protein